MAKFFRKIRIKLLEANKINRYIAYAFGEIILVVFGILIALQVNNWNNDRSNRQREIKYLNNLQLDLEKNLPSLSYLIQFRTERLKGNKKLLEQINGAPVEDLSELTKNVVNSLMEEKFTPNNSTYTALTSSGNLNIISNDSIKILLLELEELYKVNDFAIEHETFDYREYISKPVCENVKVDQLMPVFLGERTVQQQNIKFEDFTLLFANSSYRNGLYITNSMVGQFVSTYREIEAKSLKIITMIEREVVN